MSSTASPGAHPVRRLVGAALVAVWGGGSSYSSASVMPGRHAYERQHIEEWLSRSLTSPLTGEPLASASLQPCHTLRKHIARTYLNSSDAAGGDDGGDEDEQ